MKSWSLCVIVLVYVIVELSAMRVPTCTDINCKNDFFRIYTKIVIPKMPVKKPSSSMMKMVGPPSSKMRIMKTVQDYVKKSSMTKVPQKLVILKMPSMKNTGKQVISKMKPRKPPMRGNENNEKQQYMEMPFMKTGEMQKMMLSKVTPTMMSLRPIEDMPFGNMRMKKMPESMMMMTMDTPPPTMREISHETGHSSMMDEETIKKDCPCSSKTSKKFPELEVPPPDIDPSFLGITLPSFSSSNDESTVGMALPSKSKLSDEMLELPLGPIGDDYSPKESDPYIKLPYSVYTKLLENQRMPKKPSSQKSSATTEASSEEIRDMEMSESSQKGPITNLNNFEKDHEGDFHYDLEVLKPRDQPNGLWRLK